MSAHNSHFLTRDEIVRATSRPIARSLSMLCAVLAAIGAVVFIVGAFTGQARAWQALHFNWIFFTTISQAAVIFVAVQRITTARWSRPVIRLLEGYVAFLPVAFLLLILIVVGRHHIFPWSNEHIAVAEKRLWLSAGFFSAREIVLFAVMLCLSVWYIYTCVRLDVGILPESGSSWAAGIRERMRRGFRDERREIHSTHSRQGYLAVVLVLCFGFFYSVFAWDLSMSLDIHYQSTLYSWWWFMGGWLGALMSWSLLTMWWRRYLGAYDMITEDHFHDLGKLCFAFTAFWGYLSFGQYLVTWYGNLAEETHYWHLRLISPWVKPTLMVAFLVFVFPFFGLVSRAAKVYLPTFVVFAFCSIFGLWMLRYIEIYPSIYFESGTLPFGLWEIGVALGFLGLWGWCYIGFMNAFPRARVMLMTSEFRDEVQVPVNPETMEPLPAHE
ncbi:MAG: hypothetical protein M3081_06005 [Gemmatimonadota bacterium]|nr:hypothetical protein [Gemmatimonadota bacterium]